MTTETTDRSQAFSDAMPDTASDVTVQGLEGAISIARDKKGIPHVRAQSARDAFFGQGFATAQDRLWHMDYDRAPRIRQMGGVRGRAGRGTRQDDAALRHRRIGG